MFAATTELVQTAVGTGQQLLVVKSDPAIARWLTAILTTEGYGVRVARTGEEVLAVVAEERPAAVLLNVSLGGHLDGWALLAALRGRSATERVRVVGRAALIMAQVMLHADDINRIPVGRLAADFAHAKAKVELTESFSAWRAELDRAGSASA